VLLNSSNTKYDNIFVFVYIVLNVSTDQMGAVIALDQNVGRHSAVLEATACVHVSRKVFKMSCFK
jgi:hypothetical protein